jgi:prepilin-type N-terminal cleavage/methylation domain-containing protein/prepilin-type processing-associated H-X9-DG protein
MHPETERFRDVLPVKYQRQAAMKNSRKTGFTLVELLVVIGIIALLISILLPSLKKARKAAVAVECQSNMRQLNLALTMYIQDHKQRFPRTGMVSAPEDLRWMGFFQRGKYVYPTDRCPESGGDPSVGPPESLLTYAYNQALGHEDWNGYGTDTPVRLGKLSSAEIITFCESYGWYFWNSIYGQGAPCGLPMSSGGRLSEPHDKAQNIAYLDGHVERRVVLELTYYDWLVTN